MIGKTLMLTLSVAVTGFLAGAMASGFKHYYNRFAEEEDLNNGTVNKVIIVADETNKNRGKKK
tara:strand:- start:327 stop:515 length:189 start_codon:yes stop_codon:yes gene_type:complete